MSNRKDMLRGLKSAQIHLETTKNYVSTVSNQFSQRAFDAAVNGTPIDEDLLDMQGMLSDIVDGLNKMIEVLTIVVERM